MTDLATADLESYLSAELNVEVTDTEVLHDGLNLSLGISTGEDDRAYVLRRPNKLRHTDPFNDMQQEHRILQRLEGADVPTPAPVLFCDDESVFRDPFFVFEHLEGLAVPGGTHLPARFRDSESRDRVADLLVGTLADVHSVDGERFADVCERKTPRDQLELAVDRLDAATEVTGRDVPTLRSVADWLRENVPPESPSSLIHGDFKPGNLLFAGTDRPEVSGVLDWETAALGDPLTDLGYLLLLWRDEDDPTPAIDGIEARYSDEDAIRQVKDLAENGYHPFATEPGSPSRRELVSRYAGETGRFLAHERFYRAHSALMLASVWEDLHRHYVEAGLESGFEPLADYMALVAEWIVDGEHSL